MNQQVNYCSQQTQVPTENMPILASLSNAQHNILADQFVLIGEIESKLAAIFFPFRASVLAYRDEEQKISPVEDSIGEFRIAVDRMLEVKDRLHYILEHLSKLV